MRIYMPRCAICNASIKDPKRITSCPVCGKMICNKCMPKHKCS
ncbi:MAG: hypothetical protein QXL78_05585 [Methanocellales archaeon]